VLSFLSRSYLWNFRISADGCTHIGPTVALENGIVKWNEFLMIQLCTPVSSQGKPGSGGHDSVPSQYPGSTNVRSGSLPA
jgi:hypothetical protein